MDKNILSFIWRYSKAEQIFVVALTFISFPLLYLSLELPKWIINDALAKPPQPKELFGYEFSAVSYLVGLCVLLLLLVIANGALKMRINTYKGIIGERLVRRLRFQLVDRILKFPLKAFSHVSSGELISTVTAETEPLAGYTGESVALPLFQGGTMLTILLFMFMQDWVFGLVSIALIPVQGYVIPKLQKQVNRLKKERVRRVRKLSERIGETVSGAAEIRLHGTERYTLAEFSERLGDIFYVRLEIFKKKFFMKFLNNTIGQITPFLFYLFGGYLVLTGDLTIGALVAAIGAYKDLTSPWRELLNHYQAHEDAKIKYQQIVEQFSPEGLYQAADSGGVETVSLKEGLSVRGVGFNSESGEIILNDVKFEVKEGEMIAIVGDSSIRHARLAEILAGLDRAERGQIKLGGVALDGISASWFRSRVGLQTANPHMFSGSISDNIVYGINHVPPAIADESEQLDRIQEAEASGNSGNLFEGDWKDYQSIDAKDRDSLINWYMEIARVIESIPIMYSRSLLEVFDPAERPDLAAQLLQARRYIREQIEQRGLSKLVSRFDPDTYNPFASIGENIANGVVDYDEIREHQMAASDHLNTVLENAGLYDITLELGLKVAGRLVESYREVGAGAGLLGEFGVDEEGADQLVEIVDAGKSVKQLNRQERFQLRSLFLGIIPGRHRFAPLNSRTTTRLVQARREFADTLPEELEHIVEPFRDDAYHPKLNVQANLLFGRLAQLDPDDQRTIDEIVSDGIDQAGVRTDLMLLLAESQVGINGSRLPVVAKHRISLGRILFKKPKLIIFNEALTPFDESFRRRLRANIRELIPGIMIIWMGTDVADADEFDRVLEFNADGTIVDKSKGSVVRQNDSMPTIESRETEQSTASTVVRHTDPYALISVCSMFRGLSSSQQRFLADHSQLLNMSAGKKVYHAGDEVDSAYLLISGRVTSLRRNGETMGHLGPMEVFGLLETLAGRSRLLTTEIVEDAQLLRIESDAIHDLTDDDATLMKAILQALTEQFSDDPHERDAA